MHTPGILKSRLTKFIPIGPPCACDHSLLLATLLITGARQSIFDSGSNSVHFNNVQCFGRYCSYQGMYSTGTCFYFYIAGVQCNFDTLRKP